MEGGTPNSHIIQRPNVYEKDLGNAFPKGKDQSKKQKHWTHLRSKEEWPRDSFGITVMQITFLTRNSSSSYAEVHGVFQTGLYHLSSLPLPKWSPYLKCSFPLHHLKDSYSSCKICHSEQIAWAPIPTLVGWNHTPLPATIGISLDVDHSTPSAGLTFLLAPTKWYAQETNAFILFQCQQHLWQRRACNFVHN